MGIQVMNLMPATAAAPANSSGSAPSATASSSGAQNDAFGGLLSSLSAAPKAVSQTALAKANTGSPAVSTDSSAKGHLEQMLSSLAGAKVDLKAPGLGLKPAQLQQLLAKLKKLLQDGSQDDGAELLASLLAASQMAGIQPADLAGLAQLLGTSAQGTVSDDALGSNLHLLVQAIQLMADSGGQTTLLQAVQELTPAGDAFTQQLAAVFTAPDAEAPPAVDTGPPKDESPGDADTQASATAGSNGHESTVTPTGATSPADGAAQEAQDAVPDVKSLAQALEDLIQSHQPQSTATPATQAAAQPAQPAVPANQPAVAAQLAQMAPEQPAAVTTKAAIAAVQQATDSATSSATAVDGDAKPLAVDASAGPVVPAVAPQTTGHDQATTQGESQLPQQASSGSGQGQPQLVLAAPQAPSTFAASLDVAQLASSEATARPAVEQSVLDQVVQSATLALRNGEQEFRIQLKPDFLGVMEVRVSVDSGTVSVRMSVESAATRQLIDNNIGQLKQAFGTDNVRVEHVPSFTNSDATASSGQGNQPGFWQGPNPQAAWNPLPEAIPYNGDGEAEAAVAAQPSVAAEDSATNTQHSALVDLKA